MRWILFWISLILITLELLQTKLFAFSLEPSLFYVAIGVALLGMGVAGSLLALRTPAQDTAAEARRLARWGLLGFAVTTFLSHVVFARTSDSIGEAGHALVTGLTLLALALPYLCVGVVITALLSDHTKSVATSYAANLVGSAAGCVGVFVLLRPLGAANLLSVLAAASALLALPLTPSGRPRLMTAGLAAVLLASGLLFGDRLFAFRIQPYPGQLAVLLQAAERVNADPNATITVDVGLEHTVWDPMGRIDVTDVSWEPRPGKPTLNVVPSKWFTQDSSYGSPLVGVGEDGAAGDPVFFRSLYGAGYVLAPERPDALVIGLGGAPDIQAALRHGAQSVTGVDINASTVDMVRGPFAEFLGEPYTNPEYLGLPGAEVNIAIADGRGFLEGDDGRYDVMQLTGVDTKFVLAFGNLAVHENYLYTVEGFEQYVGHLTEDGVLAINYGGDLYLQRLAATAMEALRRIGVEDPADHIALLRQGKMPTPDGKGVLSRVVCILVKRSPFTAQDCDRLRAFVTSCNVAAGRTGVVLLPYEAIELSIDEPVELLWVAHGESPPHGLMDAARRADDAAFLASIDYDLEPVTDDRPFFFHLFRRADTLASLRYAVLGKIGLGGDPPRVFLGDDHALLRQAELALMMGLFAVALILGPLLKIRGRGERMEATLPWALYFSALGLGFILVEVSLIQRYVLFLGHQIVAISTVIGGLLVAAGVGSFFSDKVRLSPRSRITGAVGLIVLSLFLLQAGLPWLFTAAAGLPGFLRVVVGLLALAPLGVAMGVLFPTGLACVRDKGGSFVPWAIGINGVFSVIASTVSGPLAILFGFRVTGAVGASIYLIALGAALWSLRGQSTPEAPPVTGS